MMYVTSLFYQRSICTSLQLILLTTVLLCDGLFGLFWCFLLQLQKLEECVNIKEETEKDLYAKVCLCSTLMSVTGLLFAHEQMSNITYCHPCNDFCHVTARDKWLYFVLFFFKLSCFVL